MQAPAWQGTYRRAERPVNPVAERRPQATPAYRSIVRAEHAAARPGHQIAELVRAHVDETAVVAAFEVDL